MTIIQTQDTSLSSIHTKPENSSSNNVPHIINDEKSPILSISLIKALAQHFGQYNDELLYGEFRTARYHILPTLYDLTWHTREEAKQAVRERDIPIKGDRVIFHSTEKRLHGQEIYGDFYRYIGLAFPIPDTSLRYITCENNHDITQLAYVCSMLNFITLDVGFKALRVEKIGHEGLHIWMRSQEKSDTHDQHQTMHDEINPHSDFYQATQALEEWKKAQEKWNSNQTVGSKPHISR